MAAPSRQPSTLTWDEVTTRRMERHGLVAPFTGAAPHDVARTMCGAHAQVMSAAELSIGRRLPGAIRGDVRRALWQDHLLVKTFGPRGTVHLLPTADLPMWIGALSSLPASVPNHPEPVRFAPDEVDEVVAAIDDALSGAELTIDELTDAIEDRTGPWAVEQTMDAFRDKWPRWRQVTSTAAHRGVLCFGRDRDRKVTYTSPHRWLPGLQPDNGDQAMRKLLACYLHAYGPAAPTGFARWLNIPTRLALELFDRFADMIDPVTFEGNPSWVLTGDTAAPQERHRGIRLLPYFDAFVVASQPRQLLYPDRASRALSPSGQAGNFPVMLVDGVVGGVWHQRRSGNKLTVTVEPLCDLTAAQRRELDEEVELVGSVMEARPTLTIGTISVGPHA